MVDAAREPDVTSDPNLDDPRDTPEPDEGTSSDWTSEGGAMPQGPATAPDASEPHSDNHGDTHGDGSGSAAEGSGGQRSEVSSLEDGAEEIFPSDATAGYPLGDDAGGDGVQEGAAGPEAPPRNDDRGRRPR